MRALGQAQVENESVSEPTTRELILQTWRNGGGWHTPRRMAPWLGRPVAEVRAELQRMEAEGLAGRWHERPGLEYRWGPAS